MGVAPKSDVSVKRNWFQRRDSLLPRSTRRERQLRLAQISTEKALSTPVSSRRQRRSLQNSSSAQQFKDGGTALKSTPVPDLSKQGSTPLWLLRLYTLHRHSSVVAFLLVAATLVVYGLTVYSQQLWSQAYRKMQNLQRYERQLTTTNEVLKNKMAQEAQTSAGLVSPSPGGTIFLRPALENSNPLPPNTIPNSEPQKQTPAPLGY